MTQEERRSDNGRRETPEKNLTEETNGDGPIDTNRAMQENENGKPIDFKYNDDCFFERSKDSAFGR